MQRTVEVIDAINEMQEEYDKWNFEYTEQHYKRTWRDIKVEFEKIKKLDEIINSENQITEEYDFEELVESRSPESFYHYKVEVNE